MHLAGLLSERQGEISGTRRLHVLFAEFAKPPPHVERRKLFQAFFENTAQLLRDPADNDNEHHLTQALISAAYESGLDPRGGGGRVTRHDISSVLVLFIVSIIEGETTRYYQYLC